MKISIVVAMARNNVIGHRGKMPWHLPADLKRFREITWGKPILMGRRTFEAIGRPLPGRENIVISRTLPSKAGVKVFRSVREALEYLQDRPEIMVIGGERIFAHFLPRAEELHLTEIDAEFPGDTRFPEWNEAEWIEIERREFPTGDEGFPYPFRFRTLRRVDRTSRFV